METEPKSDIFSGNIFIFYAFDIGDDIDLDKLETQHAAIVRPYSAPKYLKNYQTLLNVELPHPHSTSNCFSSKVLRFGVFSLIYKISFSEKFDDLQQMLIEIDQKFQEQSVVDAFSLYKKVKSNIVKPHFFQLRTSYTVIQVNPKQGQESKVFKEQYGSNIASLLRMETKHLSSAQRNEVLESTSGYYRSDLVVIDTEAAFILDAEYEDLIEIFEFANIQQLELQYYDQMLSKQLNVIYESRLPNIPWSNYLPFVNTHHNATLELGRMRVDISVVTEQLQSNIRLTGDPYMQGIYEMLFYNLDLKGWQDSIIKKLDIIKAVQGIYENQVTSVREDMLSVLVIILILIEVVVGLLHYFK